MSPRSPNDSFWGPDRISLENGRIPARVPETVGSSDTHFGAPDPRTPTLEPPIRGRPTSEARIRGRLNLDPERPFPHTRDSRQPDCGTQPSPGPGGSRPDVPSKRNGKRGAVGLTLT